MMNDNNIPVSGIVMMIRNEDGSFSPLGFASSYTKVLIYELLQKASEKEPLVRSNEKYIRKEKE